MRQVIMINYTNNYSSEEVCQDFNFQTNHQLFPTQNILLFMLILKKP